MNDFPYFKNYAHQQEKTKFMKRTMFLLTLCLIPVIVRAEGRDYSLSPRFHDTDKAEFRITQGARGQTIKGALKNENGIVYSIPDTCEPEGGDPELIDAYVLDGKERYFLFRCAWSVRHPGIGLNGIQYETFVYLEKKSKKMLKETKLSRMLSDYEGSLEGGGRNYSWYSSREIMSDKLLETEAGKTTDSLILSHKIALARLNKRDTDAIKSYLTSERIQKLLKQFPVSKATAGIYNDLGYALERAGENIMAYEILKRVEEKSPDRIVLKLNIADALWETDKAKSKIYYKEYIAQMKAIGKLQLIPSIAFERVK